MARILLVRMSAMGDVVHALGAAEALARALPEAELHFAVQRTFAPLLEHLGHLSVLVHDRRPALRGLVRTAARARRLAFDVALDLQGNWKSALVCRLSGARRRIGPAPAQRREPRSRLLLNEVAAGTVPLAPHPARLALAVVRALAPEAEALPPRLIATAAEIEREAAAVRRAGVDPRQPFRALVWAGAADPRSWPARAMLRETRQGDAPALWVAGPDEAEAAVPDGVAVLRHGRGELRRLVALGHVLAAAGGTALGPDRGATHVLAACGARTLALFGPQDPALTAPPSAAVLVAARAPACAPCRRRRCRHAAGPVCMDFTSAEARPAPRARDVTAVAGPV